MAKIPKHIIDLVSGYIKQESDLNIAICLTKLIATYFMIYFNQLLFEIDFLYSYGQHHRAISQNYQQEVFHEYFSTIQYMVFLKNITHELILNIGNNISITISLANSVIVFKNKITLVCNKFEIEKMYNHEPWYFEECSNIINNNILINFQLNRKTQCSCSNKDGSIQIYFRNRVPDATNIHPHFRDGSFTAKDDDGYIILTLDNDFDYFSKQKVSIQGYNINEMTVLPNSFTNLSVGAYGIGRQCCFWAADEAYNHSLNSIVTKM